MASLKEIDLKFSYHKGKNDIAKEFYLPCMNNSLKYSRAVGFFNSTVFLIAWPSLKEFIKNGGKIRIICSPVLSKEDIMAIEKGETEKVLNKYDHSLQKEIKLMLEDNDLRKPTKVLASLVSLGYLEFRIAFMKSTVPAKVRRIFHDKVGIFEDEEGNAVVFKGSMNESWMGLSKDGNLESIDVYNTWSETRERFRVNEEMAYFNELWHDNYPSVVVKKFPEISRIELMDAKDDTEWEKIVSEICEKIDLGADGTVINSNKRQPYPHQLHAIEEWKRNGRRGIFEHATGSGKTFTALCLIEETFSTYEIPLIIVPSELLLFQWKDEIFQTFNDVHPQILLCGAGHNKWRTQGLLANWSKQSFKPRIILTTVQTAASNTFIDLLNDGPHIFLVADEVHCLGSSKNRNICSLQTGPRLGLSATPRRAGDFEGTQIILDYFDGIIQPPFTLNDAINANRLTPYKYIVHTVELEEYEQKIWEKITKDLVRLFAQKQQSADVNINIDDVLSNLLFKIARILKNASNKIKLALEVISKYYQSNQWWIVYCDSQMQLNSILSLLQDHNIKASEYHTNMTGDREQTLKLFKEHGGILVSIRCLDEGVDIPPVDNALILASSKNPREFIQRRGRVLRKYHEKILATIHDTIVLPKNVGEDNPIISIVEGELARAIQFGKSAVNVSSITDIQRIALHYNIDPDAYVNAGYEDE